ncbi:MAG: hypothetical protein ACLUFW_11035 [Alistipes sp.]
MTLREQLLELTEPKYMKFTSALMPGVENVLGIRLPVLRSIAKEIAAGDWRAYLAEAEDFYFEERMLQGPVIGYARCEPAEKLAHRGPLCTQDRQLGRLRLLLLALRAAERQPMWEFIQPYFHAQAEYDVRFAVVMDWAISLDEQHLEAVSAAARRHPPRSLLRPHGRGMGGVGLLRQISAARTRLVGSCSLDDSGPTTNRCRKSSSPTA